MDVDISQLLADWPYEPGQLAVRLIEGADGSHKIQIRVELGLLQLEPEGRPDGQRPEGFESLLELHEARLDDHLAADGEPEDFVLSPEECRLLREEAAQYYHRYVALYVLEDYESVVRDTSRNLRLIELCSQHAKTAEDRAAFLPFRPYLCMMRARALAGQAMREGEHKAAMLALDSALDAIARHFEEAGAPEAFDASDEALLLRQMRDALAPKLPSGARAELRQRLRQALEAENYELAAILRDELRSASDE